MELISRFFDDPARSFFLFGPRGTGKSTLMQRRYPGAIWIDLLNPKVLRQFLAYPELLQEKVAGSDQKIIVIDEVQKAPSLLSVVHALIEQKKGYQFILTGSSARKLKRSSADLLGGRALRRVLHPFMAAELGANFSLTKALQDGLLPLLFADQNPTDTLEAYVSLYLHEEIQAEGLVRNLEGFTRFLQTISFSHASLLNISNIARECEVKRKTVENYIEILEELLLAFQLTNFTKRAKRALSVQPKFYLFDVGVYRVLRPRGPLDIGHEIDGAALEGLVAQHLRAWNDYSKVKNSIHFWRTRSGVEVDFIIYGPDELWAIEVKSSDRVDFKDTQALEAFLEDYPMAKTLLLYCGSETIKKKNVLCVPCDLFLKQLRPNQPLFEVEK
jgi:predicted AAA+ superfamily ATPase